MKSDLMKSNEIRLRKRASSDLGALGRRSNRSPWNRRRTINTWRARPAKTWGWWLAGFAANSIVQWMAAAECDQCLEKIPQAMRRSIDFAANSRGTGAG